MDLNGHCTLISADSLRILCGFSVHSQRSKLRRSNIRKAWKRFSFVWSESLQLLYIYSVFISSVYPLLPKFSLITLFKYRKAKCKTHIFGIILLCMPNIQVSFAHKDYCSFLNKIFYMFFSRSNIVNIPKIYDSNCCIGGEAVWKVIWFIWLGHKKLGELYIKSQYLFLFQKPRRLCCWLLS